MNLKHGFPFFSTFPARSGAVTLIAALTFTLTLSACRPNQPSLLKGPAAGIAPVSNPLPTAPPESRFRHITLIGTNDIHGGIEPTRKKDGTLSGGLSILSGTIRSIRKGLEKTYGKQNAAVLVLDAGDQFQGTLLSNFSEGEVTFLAMNEVGYDAVVPGNHDYDFGPIGWLEDRVSPRPGASPLAEDQNPRGVIEKLAKQANFPLISANTYLKASLRDQQGNSIAPELIEGKGCQPKSAGTEVRFEKAERPSFLKPYVIKKAAGIRVALIGIDNAATPTTTTPENVSDLCFRDEFDEYRDVRASLEGQAEIFVLVIHHGNINKENFITRYVEKLKTLPGRAVDAVIAGHTHMIHDVNVDGVHAIQSGANGERFGRIDLVYDTHIGTLDHSGTQAFAGIRLESERCDPTAAEFCQVRNGDSESDRESKKTAQRGEPGKWSDHPAAIAFEGVALRSDLAIERLIEEARKKIAPMATRKLGTNARPLRSDRTQESALANLLTDALREASRSEITFMNASGMRAELPQGEITYEQFYRVLPFNNRAVTLAPLPWTALKRLLTRSAQTCGEYGALLPSGLRAEFRRDCEGPSAGTTDPSAVLLKVYTPDGELLWDAQSGFETNPERTFRVTTLDFLASGGGGYSDFKVSPPAVDLGVAREIIADSLIRTAQENTPWPSAVDGRWFQVGLRTSRKK